MNITEYNSKNMGKQVLVLRKDDIKILNHFASIAKSGELKGLIVAGKYAGFTDTYRLASIKDTHEDLPGTYAPLIFPILEELKKANSIAVLKDGKIAVQVEMEVTEYEPMKDIKVPNISKVVEDLEYESYSEAYPAINFSENTVWKMLKTPAGQERYKKYFNFENGKVTVEAYPNEDSKLVLEILKLVNDRTSLVTDLNCKYLDLWFKWTKNSKFELALGKNNKCAVKFSKDKVDYIVMPLSMME
nr:MAG TPA: DNA polymerase III subunit beta clamp, transferase.0A [Caudoviricetes sp.]